MKEQVAQQKDAQSAREPQMQDQSNLALGESALPNLLARHGPEAPEEKTAKSQGQVLVDPPLAACVESHWCGSYPGEQDDLCTVVAASLKNTKAADAPNQDAFSYTRFKSGYTLICVFDGHGKFGHFVSERAVQTVPWFMVKECGFDKEDVDQLSMKKARTKTDSNYHQITWLPNNVSFGY